MLVLKNLQLKALSTIYFYLFARKTIMGVIFLYFYTDQSSEQTFISPFSHSNGTAPCLENSMIYKLVLGTKTLGKKCS